MSGVNVAKGKLGWDFIVNRHWKSVCGCAAVLSVFVCVYGAASFAKDQIHLISTTISGGEIEDKDGQIVGVYPAVFGKAADQAGVTVGYRLVPWARATVEAEQSSSLLVFPLTRSAERENRYTWVTKLLEDKICFASFGEPVNSLDEARKRKRVLVWRGSSQKTYLEKQGFNNLVVVGHIEKVDHILSSAPDSAWFHVCDQVQPFLSSAPSTIKLTIGSPITSESMWLAGGKELVRTPAIDKFAGRVEALVKSGELKKLLAGLSQ